MWRSNAVWGLDPDDDGLLQTFSVAKHSLTKLSLGLAMEGLNSHEVRGGRTTAEQTFHFGGLDSFWFRILKAPNWFAVQRPFSPISNNIGLVPTQPHYRGFFSVTFIIHHIILIFWSFSVRKKRLYTCAVWGQHARRNSTSSRLLHKLVVWGVVRHGTVHPLFYTVLTCRWRWALIYGFWFRPPMQIKQSCF